MTSSYVLEIPDLNHVLNQEDIARWEIFLSNAASGYEKISWQVSSSEDCYVFQNTFTMDSRIKSVKIDFKEKRITFYKGETDTEGFKEFLEFILAKMFIRIKPDQMHFLVSPEYSKWRKQSIRR